jgi:hypothetical protein
MKTKNLFLIALISMLLVMPLVSSALETPTIPDFLAKLGPAGEWLYNHIAPSISSGVVTFFGGDLTPTQAFIIGLIVAIMIFAVLLDIIMLVTPFSKTTNWIIGIGVALIAIMSSLTVKVAAGFILVGTRLFAWAGAAGIFLTIILGILVIWFIFFGGNKISDWIQDVKARGKAAQDSRNGTEAGGKIRGLKNMAREALKED